MNLFPGQILIEKINLFRCRILEVHKYYSTYEYIQPEVRKYLPGYKSARDKENRLIQAEFRELTLEEKAESV
jgi:hypothetical protein